MNKLAEKLSKWFGSTPFILFNVAWMTVWLLLGMPVELLTLILSIEAIFLSLFILRAENIQGERMESYIKETRSASRKDLKATKSIERKIKK